MVGVRWEWTAGKRTTGCAALIKSMGGVGEENVKMDVCHNLSVIVYVMSLLPHRWWSGVFQLCSRPEGFEPCWQQGEGRQSSKRALSTSYEPRGPTHRLA